MTFENDENKFMNQQATLTGLSIPQAENSTAGEDETTQESFVAQVHLEFEAEPEQ